MSQREVEIVQAAYEAFQHGGLDAEALEEIQSVFPDLNLTRDEALEAVGRLK